jgi:hypothetical protein
VSEYLDRDAALALAEAAAGGRPGVGCPRGRGENELRPLYSPHFLTPDSSVVVPMEAKYLAAWEGLPAYRRDVLTAESERPGDS